MGVFMQIFSTLPFQVVLLIVGFVLLIKGADWFVEGSSSIAKRLMVPTIIIGMTIVAMGTSLPEAAVSVRASFAGNNELAVSNVTGSNLFNLLVVIGLCAVLKNVPIKRDTIKKDIPFSIGITVIMLALGIWGMILGHADGLIFIAIFVFYLLRMITTAMNKRRSEETDGALKEKREGASLQAALVETKPVWQSAILIGIGIVGIILGGTWVVNGASSIATAFDLSQNLIGLTIVAIGTSLPELVTSMVAAKKGEVDLAMGNAIGSNIFNILFVLGIAASISPVAFNTENIVDICILIVVSIIVWLFARSGKKINRTEGILMLVIYAAYMVYICLR